MLKPFLIRDLEEDSQQPDIVEDTASDLYNATDVSVGPQRRHGLVQLAAEDYDEIAYIHPQARLTYLDEDDGETITVGSSLELAQRLDEPPPQITDTGFPTTIHLFDIKRRKSITDIWKRFGFDDRAKRAESPDAQVVVDDRKDRDVTPEPNTSCEEKLDLHNEEANATGNDAPESLLSAFEAAMAGVMNESRHDPTANTSSRNPQTESASNLPRETTEAFASAIRSVIEAAESISSGVRSKLPELERHLENARRALPNDITDSMRNAFMVFEDQVKAMVSALNNLPETIRRDNGPGNARRFPEIPTPAEALNGFRDMGAQLGGIGQSLLDTFESSVRNAWAGQPESFFTGFPNYSSQSNNPPTSDPGNPTTNPFQPRDVTASPFAFPFGSIPSPATIPPQAPPPTFWGPPYPRPFPMSWYAPGPLPFTANPGPGAVPQPPSDLPSSEPHSFEPIPSRSLFIGNLGFNVTERMVKDVFTSKGLEVDVYLPLDSRSNKHAGFGYLTFPTDDAATSGLIELQGAVIDGHCINLEYVDHTPITSLAHRATEHSNVDTASSPQTSGVVRRDTADDSPSTGRDNNSGSKPNNETVHDRLLAQTEARFPPVSQLDAHMLAGQSTTPKSRDATNAEEAVDAATGSTAVPPHHIPGSFPQETYNAPLRETPAEAGPTPWVREPHNNRHAHYHFHPRRAATVRLPGPDPRSFDPFEPQPGLRRRATERHSLRGNGRHAGPRHRASFHQFSQTPQEQAPERAQPLGAHAEESAPYVTNKDVKKQQKQRAIDECINALSQMGYGNEEDGGRQRLAIYAAAAKGELVEAIEMIEEERKAYEQRG